MRIAFCCQHPYYGGLSPNGGSKTILLSADALRGLGHEVCVVTRSDKFDWFKHPKPVKNIPLNTDVCIAVSASDIKPMLTRMPKRAKAFWWCRGIESWAMPKKKIIKLAAKIPTLVNSEGLQTWFKNKGVDTTVVYQGIDVNLWKDENIRGGRIIGFLVSNKPSKHFDVVEKIVRLLGSDYEYVGYGGKKSQDSHTLGFTSRNFLYFKTGIKHPELLRIYNMADTWVATSTKEGLHNCPLEAALCGCSVVYPDAILGGCGDHCVDGKTAWEYEANNHESACVAIRKADKSRNEAHKALIKEKIGDRTQAMKRFVEVLNA